MAHYNTNIASEFYVISTLARLGLNAQLTLGNKKSVDITVTYDNGTYRTLDVKGVADKMDWLIGNKQPDIRHNHFFILVTYNGKINDLTIAPDTWIIPSQQLENLQGLLSISKNGQTRFIRRAFVLGNDCAIFKENWAGLMTY